MSDYRCQHCGVAHPPSEWMFHQPHCPHGKINPDRLLTLPTWKLEEELIRRADPAVITELAKDHKAALEHAELLSTCLVMLVKLSRLTRYTKSNHTVINVPNGIICEMDRVLADRGVVPLRIDDHAD